MRHLHVPYIKIVISEDRASHRAHENRAILQPQILQSFRN